MKTVFPALALGVTALALAGCEKAQEKPVEQPMEHEAAPAAETGVDGLTVSKAHLMMPTVTGNPAGVFFDLSYTGTEDLTLESAEVSQSKGTMIHDVVEKDGMKQMVPLGPLTLKGGESVSFAPGGKHIMAMKLDEAVAPGGKVDVKLTFAGGKVASFTADVMPAGEMKMEH